jgi:hypothetical protein
MRRLHVRGRGNVAKRVLLQAAAFNLALILRSIPKAGTPKGLKKNSFGFIASSRCSLGTTCAYFRGLRKFTDQIFPFRQSAAEFA